MCALDMLALYRATEHDMLFGVGLVAVPDQAPAPLIQIHYPTWSRQMLEIIRESLQSGVTLAVKRAAENRSDIYLATRQRITLQTTHAGQSSALRAPAWDARLENVDQEALRQLEAGRRRFGGFLMVIQTPEWEFFAAIDESRQQIAVEAVRPRRMPIPGRA